MKRKILITLGIVTALLAVAGGYAVFAAADTKGERDKLLGPNYEVTRHDLLVSITEGGNVEAVREVQINSEVRGQHRIISLVDEGTYVNKGDLLVELDDADLLEKLDQQEITYQSALSAYKQAVENVEIRKSLNATQIKDAELSVQFAAIDLEKYRDGEWPMLKKNAQAAITLAEAELTRAKDRLTWTEELHKKGYATRSELEADRLSVKRQELQLAKERENLRMMEKYTHPQKITKLKADSEKAQQELIRVKRRANAELASQIADLKAKEATKSHREARMKMWGEQIARTKIRAPQSGLVVYPRSHWRGRDNSIEVGAMVHERQQLLKLPDTQQMKVEVKVHESSMSLLKLGQLAYITIDAYPDQRFQGQVEKIAVMPDAQNRWLNPDLKVYTTEVVITDDLPPGTKPGLSAKVEIIITKLEDVLSVPIQAVSTIDGKQVCFVRHGDDVLARQVVVGMFNDVDIEIRAGLEEGDVVLLNPPSGNEVENLGITIVATEEVTREELKKAEEERLRLEAKQKAEEEARRRSMSDSGMNALLQRVPADKREEFRKRLESMSEADRKKLFERMRSRRRGGSEPSDDE